jgi:DNA-binding NarL/FixJ family response regulator
MSMEDRILVAIMGAQEVVSAGLRAVLSTQPDIEILDTYPAFGVIPDVIVYDALAIEADDGVEVFTMIKEQESAVLVMGRVLRPDLAARALAHGAAGVFSLEADSATIHEMVRAAATGELDEDEQHARASVLGADVGLTQRETQVLGGITRGLRNEEICELLGLSSNTVKSYIRSAYRRIGVETRSQAVAWCLTHGFEPPSQTG